jgi:tetratricopeptide (TPR) repeat protein
MPSATTKTFGELATLMILRKGAIHRWLTYLPFDWPDWLARRGGRLTRAGRLEAAEALLSRAAFLWPHNGHIALNYAFVAEARGDMIGYADRWRALREQQGDQPWAHAGLGAALRKIGRLEQARDVLREAQNRFPEDTHIAIESAWLAVDLGELEQAVTLWQRFAARFPDRLDGPLGQAAALRSLLRFDEADAVLEAAMQRFPNRLLLLSNHAVNADMRGDREAALVRWQNVVERFPEDAIGYAGVGAALKALKQFDTANTVLSEAMSRFPNDANLGINHAWVAEAEQDWQAALQRWRGLLTKFPDHPTIRNGVSESAMKAQLASLDKTDSVQTQTAAPTIQGRQDAHRDLLMQFEALGENCEFGFVQRQFGAEPLSLLRWAGISCACLIAALDTGFAGVGDPEHTVMGLNPHNHEYFTEDRRYGMSMHTFLQEDATKRDKIYQSICRRLTFLKEKLLQELAEAEKIFVYSTSQRLSDKDLQALFVALRQHGPVTLLHVCPGGPNHIEGEVISPQAGLLVGFIDRAGYDGKRWDISFDLWLTICQRAREMHSVPAEHVVV